MTVEEDRKAKIAAAIQASKASKKIKKITKDSSVANKISSKSSSSEETASSSCGETCDVVCFSTQAGTASTYSKSHKISATPLQKGIVQRKNDHKPVLVTTTTGLNEALQLKTAHLYKIPLVPVDCNFGFVREIDEEAMELRQVCRKDRRGASADCTVVFAIRRPGCGACREHALQLNELLVNDPKISVLGVIKQVADKDALIDFYQQYFRNPIYKDNNWDIYKAMGGRKIGWCHLIINAIKMGKRYKEKNIENIPFGGDIRTQGGVLIFDKRDRLRYCYYENYGDELDMDEIRRAIQAIRSSETTVSEGSSESEYVNTPSE